MTAPDWLQGPDREFFAGAIPRIEQAARKHHLRVEPWFKDVAAWALHFRHPKGGTGQIVIELREGRGWVEGYWWKDDFESETRRLAERIPRTVALPPDEMATVIGEVLSALVALSEGDLVSVHPMPRGTWHQRFRRESFGAWERSLPEPRL